MNQKAHTGGFMRVKRRMIDTVIGSVDPSTAAFVLERVELADNSRETP